MRPVTGKRLLLLLAFAPLATLGIVRQASAVDIHGTACQQYYSQSSNGLNYFVDGIRNEGSNPRYVICPLPRISESTTYGPVVYVSGGNSSGAQTSCTAYSVEFWSGSIYAAKGFSTTSSRYNRSVGFSNAEMPWAAYGSVLCYLPPNKTGVLTGIGLWH